MLSIDFTAVDARAKGLALHLFSRPELEALAGRELTSLAAELARSPKLAAPLPERPSAAELERAVRQTARHHVLTLSRWDGAGPVLGVFYAEQDRRSLRAMLRGALAASPAEERLAGLIPTPTLPERVLGELARQPTPAAVVTVLFAVGHPFAARLLPLTAEKQPDLLALERELAHAWAERATQEAKRGDVHLRRFVAQRIDVANLLLRALTAGAPELEPERFWLAGGTLRPEPGWSGATATERASLAALVVGTPLAPLAAELSTDPARAERAAFLHALSSVRALARVEPLSSAPVLQFLVRLEAQARDLRRLIWAAALGAPATLVKLELVTP